MASPPALLDEADYEAIEAAVMETARGRWFLTEYARRNRTADTTMLLKALDRIEASVGGQRVTESVDRVRYDLVEMAKAIARTKAEIAAIKPDAANHGKFGEATAELDSIVSATEAATSDILACAEQIQEIGWTLREQGLEAEVCDLIDAKATDVYTACSFQDLTGQRTRKVINVLRYLEGRINAMIGIWGLDGTMAAEADEAERAARSGDAALLNGPALPGQGLDQADVDMVMGPAALAGSDFAIVEEDGTVIDLAPLPSMDRMDAAIAAAMESDEPAPPLQPAAAPSAAATKPARPVNGGALAPIVALTPEEKIALFS
jgi:chemotaxis regulatin CheY-phosphate phosphatase CheZ